MKQIFIFVGRGGNNFFFSIFQIDNRSAFPVVIFYLREGLTGSAGERILFLLHGNEHCNIVALHLFCSVANTRVIRDFTLNAMHVFYSSFVIQFASFPEWGDDGFDFDPLSVRGYSWIYSILTARGFDLYRQDIAT